MVIAAGIVFWLVLPAFHELKAERQALREKESVLAEKTATWENFEKTRDNFNKVKKETKEELNVFLPREGDIPSLLVQIEELGKKSNLVFKSMTISKNRKKGAAKEENLSLPYQQLTISLEAEGGYGDIKRFLDVVEKNLRLLDVEKVEISKSQASSFEETLALPSYLLNAEIKTYLQK